MTYYTEEVDMIASEIKRVKELFNLLIVSRVGILRKMNENEVPEGAALIAEDLDEACHEFITMIEDMQVAALTEEAKEKEIIKYAEGLQDKEPEEIAEEDGLPEKDQGVESV